MFRIIYIPEERIMREDDNLEKLKKYYNDVYKDYKNDYRIFTPQQWLEFNWEF